VSRRVRPLTGDEVAGLPGDCSRCLFWEQGTRPPDPRVPAAADGSGTPEATVRKQAWVTARVQDGIPPGRVVIVDAEPVAYSLVAPAASFAPRGMLRPMPGNDALLLATAWVHPLHREAGIGRLLVQAALRDALRLDLAAVEAFGDRRWRERGCVLPATWLLHEGFEIHTEHPRTPLFRLDVRRTLRWAGSLEQAWEEVLGRLPRRVPAPASDPLVGAGPTRDPGDPGP
jgi:GNAT superfamily N-acetyltransferase